jgi:hypothetical protein
MGEKQIFSVPLLDAEGTFPSAGWRFYHLEFVRRRKQRVANQ